MDRMTIYLLTTCVLGASVGGCDDGPVTPPGPVTSWPADQVVIVVTDESPEALRWAGTDLQAWIEAATGAQPELVSDLSETSNPYLLLLGEGPWECPSLAHEQEYLVESIEHQGRSALRLCGGGLLGQQYAVYAYLFALGFRFVHPEQTFVPTLEALPPGLPDSLLPEAQRPLLEIRGFHEHTQHPLELLEALLTDDPDEVERAHRFVDWLVRNQQNIAQWILLDSVPQDEMLAQAGRIVDYAHRRGVKVSAVTSFNEEQQNAHRLINTGDSVDDLRDLRTSLDALMEVEWDLIVINLGASEFSETDDVETVEWMNVAAEHLASIAPETRVYASNHVPAGIMSETYGVNFYDLPQFADPGMGSYVHTTMCYGLEGPAPVYGNTDFARQRNFLLDQVDDRSIIYYPESAWWLTFDNAIPISPTMYLTPRSADLRLIAGVEDIDGHVTFSSGWEWGYWLTDLMIARQGFTPDRPLDEVLDELLSPVAPEASDIMTRLAESEWNVLVVERLMPFMTAEDLPTEIGYRAGIIFHPLAPAPTEVMSYDEERLNALAEQLENLEAFCEELDGFTSELASLRESDATTPHEVLAPQAQDGAARRPAAITAAPLLEELHDSTAITAARCWNALFNYRALSAARSEQLGLAVEEDAEALLGRAAEQTELAERIVERRETAYRYEPARVSDHEDTGGDGVDNITDYPYRVNGRTHVLYFWHRRDRLTQEAVGGQGNQLVVAPQQLLAGGTVVVDASGAGFDDGTMITVTWGDGEEGQVAAGEDALLEHLFAAPAQPTLAVTAVAEGDEVAIELALSVATAIYDMPSSSFHLVDPQDPIAEAALAPFLPTLQLGMNGGGVDAPLASLAFDRDADGEADYGTVIHLPLGSRIGEHLAFEDFDITVPVESASGRFGTLFLQSATLELDLVTTSELEDTIANGRLRASVSTEELIALVVSTGVFEREGVISILSGIFGFDPAELPEVVTVELSLEGTLMERV